MTLPPRPESQAGRVLAALHECPEGASDSELSDHLGMRHQAVNSVCHKLASQGLLARELHGGTLLNRAVPRGDESLQPLAPSPPRPWFWEGNVQDTVIDFLMRDGWSIRSHANTASRERGKDVIAHRNGEELWVTVKGYPNGTGNTPADTQAKHWFADAIFDVIRYRQENRSVHIVVALPSFQKYRTLRENTRWFETAAPFSYFWISGSGEVTSDLAVSIESRR
jgi:hypothetical protein